MPDYSKGMIYKIYNDSIPDKVYYGSTIQPLHKRLFQHKKWNNKCTSHILFPNAKIVLVEKFSCKDKIELEKRERFYIENNECVNKNIPYRSEEEKKQLLKEWRINNKEYKSKKDKEYRLKNDKKIKEQKKIYSKENKEKENTRSSEWHLKNKESENKKCRLYYQQHKKQIIEKQKQRYEESKEKIGCRVCKSMIILRNFNKHCKTKKHKKNCSS